MTPFMRKQKELAVHAKARFQRCLVFPMLAMISLLAFCAIAAANSTALPKTGQTTIHTAGDDGDLQAGVAWPDPRFTDNGDGTITDNVTGLMWLQDANCASTIHEGWQIPNVFYYGGFYWEDALAFVAGINAGDYDISPCSGYAADYTDWRLPSITELESLWNAQETDSAAWLRSQGFFQVQQHTGEWDGFDYWSSTSMGPSSVYLPKNAFRIKFSGTQEINISGKKDIKLMVWPVRGGVKGRSGHEHPACVRASGQNACFDKDGNAIDCTGTGQDGELQWGISWPEPRFEDNGDGTVTDHLTGITWLKNIACLGKGDFAEALGTVADFNTNPGNYTCGDYTASYADWRLPNLGEISSLVDYSQPGNLDALPAGHPFVNRPTPEVWYWSSTTYAPDTGRAWAGGFKFGNIISANKNDDEHIWPVRGTSTTPDEPQDPDITLSENELGFGNVVTGCPWDRMLTIGNEGAGNLTIGTLAVQGENSDVFSIETDNCSGTTLLPAQTCDIIVRFSPDAGGNTAAAILAPNNDPDESVASVNLSGTGVAPCLPASCAPVPDVAADGKRGVGEAIWCLQVLSETRDDGAAGKINLEDPLFMLRALTDITP